MHECRLGFSLVRPPPTPLLPAEDELPCRRSHRHHYQPCTRVQAVPPTHPNDFESHLRLDLSSPRLSRLEYEYLYVERCRSIEVGKRYMQDLQFIVENNPVGVYSGKERKQAADKLLYLTRESHPILFDDCDTDEWMQPGWKR